jgi:hypothetical protein
MGTIRKVLEVDNRNRVMQNRRIADISETIRGHTIRPLYLLRLSLILAFLIMAMPVAVPAQADLCDSERRPIAGFYGYRRRDARCEGLYQEPVVLLKDLEMVSLLKGRLHFDLRQHSHLQISAPDISNLPSQSVRVTAVALPLHTYYRMDAVLPPHGPLLWPVHEVLARIGLTDRELGVFGWIRTRDMDEKVFIPLKVVAAASEVARDAPVLLTLRASVDIADVRWRISAVDGHQETPLSWQRIGPVYMGQSFPLVLPSGDAPILQVEIAYQPSNSNAWPQLRFKVRHR